MAAGDAICQARAAAAGLSGTFKAWLSDSTTDAISRITSNGPWVRLDGVKVADSKADLIKGSLFTAISLTEGGAFDNEAPSVFTGTTENGLRAAQTCSNWTDGISESDVAYGYSAAADEGWSNAMWNTACQLWSSLYCFED